MSHEKKSKLLTKVSPLIEGQVPDFVSDDHPVFVDFLKDYYKFLEAGKLEINVTTDYVKLETTTSAYVLLEDGNRVVDESFTGKFTNGETITGATSNATATILVEDSRNGVLYTSSQQKLITNETITGGTSGSSATVTRYRANPIQNIQQLLDYADVDNTIHDFLDQMRDSFMESIPSTLAENTSKRNLLKNIKDLYTAKGTSEGHKLFMRLLLGEDANVIYPNEYMMRPSDGTWIENQILRVTAFSGVRGVEVVGEKITGQTSGATALVKDALTVQQGSVSVTEFQIQDVNGTFSSGEVVKGRSTSRDVDVSFTVGTIVGGGVVVNDGILHDVGEAITVESIGNESAEVIVDVIKSGGVSGVAVDDAGSGYQVGDVLTFTNPSSDNNTEAAVGFVSVIGGGFAQETGTLDDSDVTSDTIVLEENTNSNLESSDIILETNGRDFFVADGLNRVFKLNNTSTLTDTLTLYLDNVETKQTATNGDSVWTIEDAPYLVLNGTDSSSTDAGDNILLEVDDAPQTGSVIRLEQQEITFTKSPIDYTPAKGVQIRVEGDTVNYFLLDGTDGSSFSNAGSKLITDSLEETPDLFKSPDDQIILEPDTFSTVGEIHKVTITNSGRGYTDLPTITITSENGSNAKLLATTDDIGAIDSVKVKDPGLDYSESNLPDLTARAHFVVKDVTGTFAAGNTLTTHEGTVRGWDSSTQVLDVGAFENVVRVDAEQSSTVNEGVQLEEGNITGSINTLLLEDIHTFDNDRKVLFDSTSSTTGDSRIIRQKVRIVENTLDTIAESTTDATLGEKIFSIDGVYETSDFTAPRLEFIRGNTYYLDLSDSSLYNVDTTLNHQLALAKLAYRFKGDGSTTSFTLGSPVEISPIAFVTTDSTSFENNVRIHANANNTSYTADADTLTFTTAPASGTHIIVFTKYTEGVVTSNPDIDIGGGYYDLDGDGVVSEDDGAFLEIEVDDNTPDLYYYCVNHGPRMGFAISTKTRPTILNDVGGILLLNAESEGAKSKNILLEDASQDGSSTGILTLENPAGFRPDLNAVGQLGVFENIRFETNNDENIILETGTESFGVKESDGTVRNAFLLLEELIQVSPIEPDTFLYETFFTDLQHVDEDVLLESFESSSGDQILLDGTDSISSDAGARLLAEDSVVQEARILLNGTDSDSDNAGDVLLNEDEDGFEEIVLNSSDSSSTDATDNIILESAIDFSNNDIVITDSGGASATIVKADIAVVTSTVDISTTITGQYSGIESLLGEDLNRIQDSYYYQDFSYEIQVGQALSTYLSELKKAVHPVGFLPFGRVSIATSVSAAITTTAAGISDYTGDTDTFSPILASVLETLFSQTIQSRLQVVPTTTGIGQRDDQIVLENGIVAGDNLVLDASAASTDVGSNILLETNDGIDLEDGILEAILYESGSVSAEITNAATEGGGRVMAESSHAPSADADRFLVREITTKISTAPTSRASRNLLLHLAKYPFGTVDSIQLETSTANQTSFLALDGEIPLAQETTFIILESGENVFLEQPSDEGQRIVAEMDTWAFPVGFKVSENDRIVLEDENQFVETIPLSEIGDFRFEDIRAIDKIILGSDPSKSDGNLESFGKVGFIELNGTDSSKSDGGDNILIEDDRVNTGGRLLFEGESVFAINVDQDNANAVENVGILMENFGHLLLDGTDSSSTNAGSYVAQETTKNNRFTLEESGSLIVEENSTYSVVEYLRSETTNEEKIMLEDFFNPRNTFGIRLEQDSYTEDVIVLDGIDSSSTDAGIKLELEEFFQSDTSRESRLLLEDHSSDGAGDHIMMENEDLVAVENEPITNFIEHYNTALLQLETTNIVSSKGQIPLGNWTLNSSTSPVGYQPVVHASEIRVRSTGEIALEDSTDTTHGYLVLNGTDGSSTNAGDNIDCEGATGIAA